MNISKIINFMNEGALRGDYIIRGLDFIKPTLTLQWINLVDYLMSQDNYKMLDNIISGLEKYNNGENIDYIKNNFVKNIVLNYGIGYDIYITDKKKVLK